MSAPRHPTGVLAALALAGISYAILSSVPVPALPQIRSELGASQTGAGWILTSYLLASAVATALVGRLGDIYGKRRMLLIVMALLVAGALLGALARSLEVLIVARVIQGAGSAIFPLAFGIIRDEFPEHWIAGGIGLMSATLAIGGGLGLVGAGPIVEQLSWHWLFWIPLGTSAAALVMIARLVPESPVRTPGRVNVAAAALMSVSVCAVLVAISQTTAWGWGSAKTLGLLAAGFAVAAAWIATEVRSDEPLVDMRMMRVRGVWTTNASSFLLGMGMFASFFLFPQFAELPRSTGFGFGASVTTAGLYLLPMTVLMAVCGAGYGRLAQHVGAQPVLVVGTLLTGASFLLFRVAHAHPHDMVLSAAIFGIGLGLAFAATADLIVAAVPPEQTGVATGMNTVMRTLGGAVGGQIAATLVAHHVSSGVPLAAGFNDTFTMGAVLLAVAAIAAAYVPALRTRADTAPESELIVSERVA